MFDRRTVAEATSEIFQDIQFGESLEPHWVNYPNKPAKRFTDKKRPSKLQRKKKNKQQKQSRKKNRS